jgi:hypothetical protein
LVDGTANFGLLRRAGFVIVKGDGWIRAQREKVLPPPRCVHSATPPKIEAGFDELKKLR